MDDLDLIKRKTGMTIGTAWILMFSSMALMFLLGISYGVAAGMGKINARSENAFDFVMLFMVVSFLIFAGIGFIINKKELPYFSKVSSKIWFLVFVLSLLWNFVASIFSDYYLLNAEMNQSVGFSKSWWFAIILNAALVIFQHGVIGHGLLRNYNLKKSIIAISFICIVFYIPAAVFVLIIQSAMLLFIYYRTASFWLVLVNSTVMYLPDYIYRGIYKLEKMNYNYYKNLILPSDFTYYCVWVSVVFATCGVLWYFKNSTRPIKWQRDEESIF